MEILEAFDAHRGVRTRRRCWRRFSGGGTWDKVLVALLAHADAAEEIDSTVSVDSTINRAHQHATNLPRGEKPGVVLAADAQGTADMGAGAGGVAGAGVDDSAGAVAGLLECDTGGFIELHESAGSTGHRR